MTQNSREKIDIGGSWQIAFDPQNQGLKSGWSRQGWPAQNAQPIQVPAIWNIEYPQADGVGFYRTTFSVPDSWQGKHVLLHFEGSIYRSEVWINDKFVGSHEGGYTPFWFDITPFIQFGEEGVLIVRVTALSKTKTVDGMVLEQTPLSKQSWYYAFGGIWGKVFLESCHMVACQELIIDPDLRRERAELNICLNNRHEGFRQVQLVLKVIDSRGEMAYHQESSVAAPPGTAHFMYTLPLPRPLPWSCEQPNLYRLEVEVKDEAGNIDHQVESFGMRDFTVKDGEFYLNGEPIYIRGILLQPNFPVNLIQHPNREMMVREITLAKEAGFNLIRTHLQSNPPGYLDLTDQMGMLVYAESCLAWIRYSPRLLDHGKREMKALIDHNRNHPSVVYWGVYNENPPASALNGEYLSQFARTIDPTRVIVDNSGGSLAIDQDFGWIDRAAMIPSWKAQKERILDIHLYLGSPISQAVYNWLNSLGSVTNSKVLVEEGIGSMHVAEEFDRESRSYQGKVFVSELGYGGMSDLDETVARFEGREDLLDSRELKAFRDSLNAGFEKRKLGKVFGTVKNLYLEAQQLQALGNTQQLEALLCNPRISGYVITQLNDVAWEFHAGLLDLWRHPKLAYYAAQRLNLPHVLVLRADKEAAAPGDSINVDLTVVNQEVLSTSTVICVTVTDPAGQEVSSTSREFSQLSKIHPMESIRVKIEAAGNYQINARLMLNGEVMAESTETILALDHVNWNSLPVKIRQLGKTTESPDFNNNLQGDASQSAIEKSPVYLAAHPGSLNEKEWETLLTVVEAGGTAVIGALRPEYQVALHALTMGGLEVKLHPGIGSWMGCYHWIPNSDLFSGLPAGCLAKKPYSSVIPKYVLSELGGEIHAGSLRNTQSRQDAPSMLWYSDIELISYGKGSILFCQYRVFDHIDENPLASRLAYNLLNYAARLGANDN